MEKSYEERMGARVAEARTALGLSLEWVAERLEVAAETIQELEDGKQVRGVDLHSLCTHLHLSYTDLIEYESDEPHKALNRVASAWQHSEDLTEALNIAREWLHYDSYLTRTAAPAKSPRNDCLAARGIPEIKGRGIPAVELPVLTAYTGSEDEEYGPRYNEILHYTAAIQELTGEAQVNGEHLAETLGAAWGKAPMHKQVRGIALSPEEHILVVVNSNHHETVQNATLLRLLVHLLLRDFALAAADTLEDQDDDSIHSCAGIGWKRDHLAHWIAMELAGPGTVQTEREQRGRDFEEELRESLQPVLQEGEQLGYWHQVDVPGWPGSLRRALGVSHEDLLLPSGNGETLWPKQLAANYVAGMNRGLTPPSPTRLQMLGIGEPGRVSVEEVEAALGRYAQVERQLEMWNQRELGKAYKENTI